MKMKMKMKTKITEQQTVQRGFGAVAYGANFAHGRGNGLMDLCRGSQDGSGYEDEDVPRT
jgi:hypothetical protein